MLHLIAEMDPKRYTKFEFLIAETDKQSINQLNDAKVFFYDDIVVLNILVILWLFHYLHKTKSRSIFYVLILNLNRLANLICLPFLLLSEAYSQYLQSCMRRNLICYWLTDLVFEVLFISYQTRYLYSCLFLGCRFAISQFTEMQNYLCRKLL